MPTGNQILDDDGNPIPISSGGMSYGNEPMIELYAVTQEQYDAVLALIDSTTTFVDYDQNVLDIISDEAAGYFAGSKTVEEASKLIQSRSQPLHSGTEITNFSKTAGRVPAVFSCLRLSFGRTA